MTKAEQFDELLRRSNRAAAASFLEDAVNIRDRAHAEFFPPKRIKLFSLILLLVIGISYGEFTCLGGTRVSTPPGGNWDDTQTWGGQSIPDWKDTVIIVPGSTVTVTADETVSAIIFTNSSASGATLTISGGSTLTVNNGITQQNAAATNTAVLIQGAGALICASLTVGGTTTPTPTSSDFLTTLTSTVSNLSISGNLGVKALYNSAQSAANQATFACGSGSVSVGGSVAFTTVPFFGPTLTLATGAQNGMLTLSGSTPFTFTGGGSSTFMPNGTNATVVYSGSSQSVNPATYQNLVLGGSGTKTTTGVTVNGTLSLQGTATVSATPSYGTNATLEYAGSAGQTSGLELPATIPNLRINNANGVAVANSPTVNQVLTLVAGNISTGTNQIIIATNGSVFGGSSASFVNGTIQKNFTTGAQSFVFPIGNSAYAPLSLTNLTVNTAGGIKASTTNTVHPQIATSGIGANQSVNRYWTLAAAGGAFGSYNATFNYPGSDVDAGATAAQFVVGVWNGAWSSATVSGTPTTNATSISGQSGFGDFVVGDPTPQGAIWSGGAGANKNWPNGTNWQGGLAPRSVDDVYFFNTGAVPGVSNINNIVDAGFAGSINSLTFGNTNNFHTTLISTGVTLTIQSNLTVGTETYVSPTQTVVATVTGPGGKLNLNFSTNTQWSVRQGVASGTSTPGTPGATLDLSGLGTFTVVCRGISAGVESSAIRRAAGSLYLAKTNVIYAYGLPTPGTTYGGNPAIYIGHNTQSQNQNPKGSAIYLGITNAIFSDYIVVGRGNQTNNLMAFNPAFITNQPVAYFRSVDGVSRVGTWTVGDNSPSGTISSPSSGTNDFTGGLLDAMVNTMFIGRGAQNNQSNAASPGIGTFIFNKGTLNVSNLYIGYQNLGTNIYSSGIGTMNVNSSNATLIVNNLELGHATNTTIVSPSGVLSVSGGTVQASNIVNGGGAATVAVSGGMLAVSNAAGTPASPLTSMALTNSLLQLSVSGVSTNAAVSTLITGGTSNRINIASLPVITSYPTQFTLIKYSGAIGGAGFNFALGTLPPATPAYQGYISNNTSKSTVLLVLTPPAPSKFAITSINGGSNPAVAAPFGVMVQSQDTNGTPRNVSADTTVALSLNAGSGVLGGTLNGTILAGTNTVTINNVTYNTAQSGVKLAATRTSGDNLTGGTSGSFTVNPGGQSITFPSPGNQTYGVAPVTLAATASSGLAVGYGVISGPASVSNNLLTITGAGSVTIQASQAGNANWTAAPITNQTISVAQKTVTGSITANNKVYDGATNATIATRSLTGVINSDVVSLAGGSAAFGNKTVGTGKTVTATGLSLSGANSGNYLLGSTAASTTANITGKGLTVIGATASNKPYDGTATAALNFASATLSGVAAGDSVNLNSSSATGVFTDKNVGTNKPVTISGVAINGADSANYTLTQPTSSANISSATLLVSVYGTNRVYGATNPVFIPSYTGFAPGDDASVLSGAPLLSTAANTNSSAVGSPYPVTVSQGTLAAANYNFNFGEGNLVVMPAPLAVTADNQSRAYGQPNSVLTASYSGFVNGENEAVLGGSPALSTAADTNSPVGAYPIVVSQGTLSDSNYAFGFTDGILSVLETAPIIIGGITGSGNQIVVSSLGLKPNNTYYLLVSTDLVQWATNASAQSLPDGTISFTNTVDLPVQFYRLYGP